MDGIRTSGLVLCGGASSRMGRDKARVELGGRPLLGHALAVFDALGVPVRLACGSEPRYADFGRELVQDDVPGAGPLAGLTAGLEAAARAGETWVAVLACDMPRARPQVLARLLDEGASALLARAEREIARRSEAALAQAREAARAELAAELLALARQRDQLLRSQPAQVAQLALVLARRIIGEELVLHPERLHALCVELLSRVRRARQVSLRVHPEDHATLEAQLAALRDSAQLAGALQLESDPTLARGDCVVVSDVGVLDARIETQLRALGKALGLE